MTIVDGIAANHSFNHLAITLRQKGLQIISASTISKSEYNAEILLRNLKNNNFKQPKQVEAPKKHKSIIRFIASLFNL